MDKLKTRKQGNSIVITIPVSFGVGEGEEFYLKKGENGTILLVPIIPDFYADAKEGEFHSENEAFE